jgi:hypothetical protein
MSTSHQTGAAKGSGRVLDPVERVSEVLFGLIMVLTFTGTLSAATAGHAELREMLYGAVGCNLAWGIVDAVMYVMSNLVNRGRGLILMRALRATRDPAEARAIISEAMNPYVASLARPSVFDNVREDLLKAPEPATHPPMTADDVRGAVGVFLLVFLSTFPVVIPFLVIGDPVRALRASNTVAVAMLCAGGYSLGRYSGMRPWLVALAMAALGAVLVAITIVLGG